ncbi:MAG: TrmH family RNA methyltransferase [Butyricicoccus pullicaecorum]
MEFTAITSRQNATLKHLARLAREKKYRLKTGEMVCEGEKMLGEALDSDIRVGAVLVRSGTACDDALLARAAAQGAALLTAEKALFDLATDVETPQGVLFSCERPVRQTVDFSSVRRAVLLDGLQDPGNLGTILRTADAFALDLVILCEGCTDPTAPKVVRATMGAASAAGLSDAAQRGHRCFAAARHSGLCRSARA